MSKDVLIFRESPAMSALGVLLSSGVLAALFFLCRAGHLPAPFFYFSGTFILIYVLLLLGKWLGSLSAGSWLLTLDREFAEVNLAGASTGRPKKKNTPGSIRLSLTAIREVRLVEEVTISWSTRVRKRREKTLMLELLCEPRFEARASLPTTEIAPELERFRSDAVRVHGEGLRLVWRSRCSWISPGAAQALDEFGKRGVATGQRIHECRDLTLGDLHTLHQP